MAKFSLVQITTFRKHIEVEADSLEEAIEKAESDTDLYYGGTDTLDFDTRFKPEPKRNKRK